MTTDAENTLEEPPIIAAERHFNDGKLEEAARICEEICQDGRQPGPALYMLGLIAGRQNRLEEAHGLLTEALRLHPAAPRLRHDLVSLCARMGRVEEAEAHLEELIARNPDDAGTFEHLALIQKGLGRTDEAIASFRQALKVEPASVGAHQALGGLLFQRGELESALPHLRALRGFKPAGEDRYQMLGLTLLALGHFDELAGWTRRPPNRRSALQRNRPQGLAGMAARRFHRLPGEGRSSRTLLQGAGLCAESTGFHDVFQLFTETSKFKSTNSKRYGGDSTGEVYAIGDSHCMMAGHLSIPIGGAAHRVVPQMVFGCKAYHLIAPGPTPYRSAFAATLARIPDGAKVIATLGEIDLRYNGGIIEFVRKNPQADPERTAADLARAYIDCLTAMARAKALDLIIMSPPASNVNRRRMPEPDRAVFDRIIEAFNAQLRQSVTEAGCP